MRLMLHKDPGPIGRTYRRLRDRAASLPFPEEVLLQAQFTDLWHLVDFAVAYASHRNLG